MNSGLPSGRRAHRLTLRPVRTGATWSREPESAYRTLVVGATERRGDLRRQVTGLRSGDRSRGRSARYGTRGQHHPFPWCRPAFSSIAGSYPSKRSPNARLGTLRINIACLQVDSSEKYSRIRSVSRFSPVTVPNSSK